MKYSCIDVYIIINENILYWCIISHLKVKMFNNIMIFSCWCKATNVKLK